MKWSKRLTIVSLSSLLVVLLSLTLVFVLVDFRVQSYIEHDPIIIWDDSDFETYDFPGKGTSNKPYLIQNYNITTAHTESIHISGTTKHFVIQNCYLYSTYISIFISNATENTVQIIDNDIEGTLNCINILNSPRSVIKNNQISIISNFTESDDQFFSFNTELINCGNSIISLNTFTNGSFDVYDSENVLIDRNEFYLRTSGYYTRDFDIESDNALILENYFDSEARIVVGGNNVRVSDNFFASIQELWSRGPNVTISKNIFEIDGYLSVRGPYSTVSENLFESGGHVVVREHSITVSENLFKSGGKIEVYDHEDAHNAMIIENEFEDGGLISVSSSNAIISNNQITNGGYAIYDASSTVENNLVNDKELGFLVNLEDEVFSNNIYGQYIFLDCANLIIRDLDVRNTLHCIFIASSNNIAVLNNNLSYSDVGIMAIESFNLDITDNFLNHSGIALGGCDNSSIANNIGYNSVISLSRSSFITIEYNNLSYSEKLEELIGWGERSYGIRLQHGSNNVIQHNIIEYCDYGIIGYRPLDTIFYNNTCNFVKTGIAFDTLIFTSFYNITVDNNIIHATEKSIKLDNCFNTTISNNVMSTGLGFPTVYGFTALKSLTIINNTINGRLLGFYSHAQNLNLSSPIFASLYLFNCSNSVVSNQVIDKTNEIALYDCDNVSVMNSSFTDTTEGISIQDSVNILLKNNTLRNAELRIRSSSNCTVLNNSCSDSENDGLYLEGSFNCLILNNSFVNCSRGIYSHRSDNCTIKFNHIMLNRGTGIYLGYISYRIDNFTIKFNLIMLNRGTGIYLGGGSENITIHHNAFIDNVELNGSQAEDYGENNFWYDTNTLEGNFWSNWISGPYTIYGDAGSVDLYPLLTNPL